MFLFFSFFAVLGFFLTRVTVGRDVHQPTNQSFRVCKVNLATLKVGIILELQLTSWLSPQKSPRTLRRISPAHLLAAVSHTILWL